MIIIVSMNLMDGKAVKESASKRFENMTRDHLPEVGDAFEVSRDGINVGWRTPIVRRRKQYFDLKNPTAAAEWHIYVQTDSPILLNHLVRDHEWVDIGGWSADDERHGGAPFSNAEA